MTIHVARYLGTALILLSACVGQKQLTSEALRKAVYHLGEEGAVVFSDGTHGDFGLIDLYAFGDLDGDGLHDAVTFVAERPGDGRIFISLEALLNRDGSPIHVATYLVGDRVGIDSIAISSGRIDLQFITQGPGDAMCCPTLHATATLKLHNGELVEVR